jgi:AmmeMemoRadiSam system protein B/AmmeMemoRadiSam system protein A
MPTRAPAVAGLFYPAEPAALDRMVRAELDAATAEPVAVKAIVAPHAGYRYSGPIAGSAFKRVAHLKEQVTCVVVIGPSHRMHFQGMAVPSATGLATPLGTVAIDQTALARALKLPDIRVFDLPFEGEHALEVELPFIQMLFPRASVVPILVGEARADAVERVLAELWGGPETLIVISSDLSHFHPYDAARKLDLGTSQAIETVAPEKIDGNGACGFRALAGLLRRAAELDLRATTHDLRNSGDTAGAHDSVVGYGAYTFEYAQQASLPPQQRQQLLDAAAGTLRTLAETGQAASVNLDPFALPLRALRRTFVTLEIDGQLRGCVGSLLAANPLVADVVANTYKAAMQDPRFQAMTSHELGKARVTISILSHLRPMTFGSDAELMEKLRPETDGLAIHAGARRALFLPKVWDVLPQPPDFLHHLKQKAGLSPAPLARNAQAFRFTAETFAA